MNQGTETHGQIATYGCTGSLVHEVWAIKYTISGMSDSLETMGSWLKITTVTATLEHTIPTIQKGHFKHNDKRVWLQITSLSLRDNSLIRHSLPLNQLASISY